ncbi:MAG: AraC family transcriptional regulator [Ramlibacter sp.]
MTERLFVRLDDDPLYAPETSVPPGTLHEFDVPADLRAWVAHVIAYEEEFAAGEEVKERVLPDGSMHLLFELQDGPVPSRVAGPSIRPAQLTLRGRVEGLSLRLRPGAAAALFGVSAHDLAERAVAWDALVAPRHRSLPDQLREAPRGEARLAVLAQALRAMRREVDRQRVASLDKAHAAAQWMRGPDRLPVHAAAARVGVSERRLQQIFQQHLGLTPGAWRRLARMHDCLRQLRRLRGGPPAPWASIAADCGFSDQSHLVNEFQGLCGLTPVQFLQRVASGSSKTAA